MKEEIRKNRILVKMSDTEKAQIEKMASECGLPVSAYIRSSVFSKERSHKDINEPDELPTKEVNVKFLLTRKESDRLNDICLKSEMTKDMVVRDCLLKGYVITLPFYNREKEIRELTKAMSELNQNLLQNSMSDELQKSVDDMNRMLYQVLRQDLMSTRRLERAIKETVRKEVSDHADKQNNSNS